MKTFKIRDLMIALRPGIGTPQRPKPFDCCLPSCVDVSDDCDGDSIQPFLDTGGCDCTDDDTGVCDCTEDASVCDCTDGDTCACTEDATCDCSDFTCGCTKTCGCTLTCGVCSQVHTCGGSCNLRCTGGCTLACSKACSRALTCGVAVSICANFSCALSVKQQAPIEQMAPAQLARLKAQLRAAAGKIRKREKTLAAAAERKAFDPKTVEQVDSLEKLLNEALEALRTRRAELQKAAETKSQKRKE